LARQRRKKNAGASGRLVTPSRVGILILFVAAIWVGSGFVSKIVVAYRLNAEAANLRQENQHLADANRAYESQLSALAQAGGKEEQERLHNYVQKDEKVYVIAQPSRGPSPYPKLVPATNGSTSQPSSGGFWHDLWGAFTSPLH
jgi:cell division protein FtsB